MSKTTFHHNGCALAPEHVGPCISGGGAVFNSAPPGLHPAIDVLGVCCRRLLDLDTDEERKRVVEALAALYL